MHRRLITALGCTVALGAAGLLPAAASAARALHVPDDATMPHRPFAGPVRDAIVEPAPPRAGAAGVRATASQAQSFYSSDGQGPIRVDLSRDYGALTRERVQPYVDFIASRLHGPELSRLTLFILTPAEIRRACSEKALACYVPRLQVMMIPGEQTPQGEVPVEYVITHEYGHHIAANRNNDPWAAIAWGPKAWATQRRVCAGVAEERYHPGDQGEHYASNPGENWAETYAQLQYRDQFPWQFDRSFAPDAATFAVAQADVVAPWTEAAVQRREGKLSRERRSQTFKVGTTLDGRVKLTLQGPRRANFNLQILSGGKVRARSRRSGSRDRLQATDCQVREFSVRVVRRSGSGRFTVRIQTPG